MNKKTRLLILAIVLISLFAFGAEAGLREVFRAGLNPFEDFFSGGWRSYEKTLAFLVFFLLFFTAYIIGMKKGMGEDTLSRAHKTFAFAAAFLSSFIIVVASPFGFVNLKYIALILLAVLIFFLLYALLSKLGLENKKILLFFLAALLTLLLLGLLWYMFNQDFSFGGGGGVGDWFSGIGSSGKFWDGWFTGGEVEEGIDTSLGDEDDDSGGVTGITRPKVEQEDDSSFFGSTGMKWGSMGVLGALAVALAVWKGGAVLNKGKGLWKKVRGIKSDEISIDDVEVIKEKKVAIDAVKQFMIEKNRKIKEIMEIRGKDPPNGIKDMMFEPKEPAETSDDESHDANWLTQKTHVQYRKAAELRGHIKELIVLNGKFVSVIDHIEVMENKWIVKGIPRGLNPSNDIGKQYQALQIICREVMGILQRLKTILDGYEKGNKLNLRKEYEELRDGEGEGDDVHEHFMNLRRNGKWLPRIVSRIDGIHKRWIDNAQRENCESFLLMQLMGKLYNQWKLVKIIEGEEGRPIIDSITPNVISHKGGNLTITGENFDKGDTKVLIDDVPVEESNVQIKPDSILVEMPAHKPGEVDVVVRNGFGEDNGEVTYVKIEIKKPEEKDNAEFYVGEEFEGELEAEVEGLDDGELNYYRVSWIVYKGDYETTKDENIKEVAVGKSGSDKMELDERLLEEGKYEEEANLAVVILDREKIIVDYSDPIKVWVKRGSGARLKKTVAPGSGVKLNNKQEAIDKFNDYFEKKKKIMGELRRFSNYGVESYTGSITEDLSRIEGLNEEAEKYIKALGDLEKRTKKNYGDVSGGEREEPDKGDENQIRVIWIMVDGNEVPVTTKDLRAVFREGKTYVYFGIDNPKREYVVLSCYYGNVEKYSIPFKSDEANIDFDEEEVGKTFLIKVTNEDGSVDYDTRNITILDGRSGSPDGVGVESGGGVPPPISESRMAPSGVPVEPPSGGVTDEDEVRSIPISGAPEVPPSVVGSDDGAADSEEAEKELDKELAELEESTRSASPELPPSIEEGEVDVSKIDDLERLLAGMTAADKKEEGEGSPSGGGSSPPSGDEKGGVHDSNAKRDEMRERLKKSGVTPWGEHPSNDERLKEIIRKRSNNEPLNDVEQTFWDKLGS